MARSYTVFVDRDRVPDHGALQAAIKALGFRLGVDDAYVPLESAGYLPCTLDGEDAGLTIRFGESAEIPGKNIAVTLQGGGDPREQVTAIMIAAAMAHACDAAVLDGNSQPASADALLKLARKQFAELD